MARRRPEAATEHAANILLQAEPEGGFTVTCPSLPGLVTYGATLEAARAMAVEAVESCLESLQIDDAPIPASDVVEPSPVNRAGACQAWARMRPRLPSWRGRAVIAVRERGGFYVHHVKGSHHVLRHPAKPRARVIVPVHRGDLPTGMLRGNIKQAGSPWKSFSVCCEEGDDMPDRAVPTVFIDNDRVRVTEWRFGPGAATGWHRHEMDYVVVPMTAGVLELVEPGGGRRRAELEKGVPYFRPAGVEHDVINANAFEFAFIEVELKAAG